VTLAGLMTAKMLDRDNEVNKDVPQPMVFEVNPRARFRHGLMISADREIDPSRWFAASAESSISGNRVRTWTWLRALLGSQRSSCF
jgi:hypothetical protein